MQFKVRDFLWLAVVLCFGVGWFIDRGLLSWSHRRTAGKLYVAEQKLNDLGWQITTFGNGREITAEPIHKYKPKQ